MYNAASKMIIQKNLHLSNTEQKADMITFSYLLQDC